MNININSREFVENFDAEDALLSSYWRVIATYEDQTGSRHGGYQIELPSSASPDDIKLAIAALYVVA